MITFLFWWSIAFAAINTLLFIALCAKRSQIYGTFISMKLMLKKEFFSMSKEDVNTLRTIDKIEQGMARTFVSFFTWVFILICTIIG